MLLSGITFKNKQIKMNERFIDMDETGQWLGSSVVGNEKDVRITISTFTQIDPNSIQSNELCKSVLPNPYKKRGISYMKRFFERLSRRILITFYFNQEEFIYLGN